MASDGSIGISSSSHESVVIIERWKYNVSATNIDVSRRGVSNRFGCENDSFNLRLFMPTEYSMKSTVTQAMSLQNPQSVLWLGIRLDELTNMFRYRQSVCDCDTKYLKSGDTLYVRHWRWWRDRALFLLSLNTICPFTFTVGPASPVVWSDGQCQMLYSKG